MRTDIKYSADCPLARLETGDKAVISVTHFPEQIVRDKDKTKYAHIPDGVYQAEVVKPYLLTCKDYPELSGYYNYWRGISVGVLTEYMLMNRADKLNK